jgi:hypothetical protein
MLMKRMSFLLGLTWPAPYCRTAGQGIDMTEKVFRRVRGNHPSEQLTYQPEKGSIVGQNILREALLIADHNAYHIGQLLLVRQLLGAWKEG